MTTTANKKRGDFTTSLAGVEVRSTLEQMVLDSKYSTRPSYSANAELYPDKLIPFVDKHMNYINAHPAIDPQLYIANLRLMSRIK